MSRLLELDGITKRFGGLIAVNNLSFTLDKGESLGLIGPNGAGKTTAFSVVMGEHRPDSGVIRYDGEDITRMQSHLRVRRGIGRTYQIPRPFGEMSVFENVRVGSMPDSIVHLILDREPEDDEWAIVRDVGFGDREAHLLPGQLSMGELRKLELARVLATRPDLMLLDEVFAGLTYGEIAQLTELLLRKREHGISFLIVSHDLKSLRPLVDRLVVMSFGEVIAEGAFDDVLADERVRDAYLG